MREVDEEEVSGDPLPQGTRNTSLLDLIKRVVGGLRRLARASGM